MKLFPSEWNIMNLLWENGTMSASDIAKEMAGLIGWNRNTTYTIIKKCIAKNAIERLEPHFLCKPLVTKEEVAVTDASEIVEERFNGSIALFVSAFAKGHQLSDSDIQELYNLIKDFEK